MNNSNWYTALKNRNDGSLMRHELAYILGQMQIPSFSGVLASVVDDEDEDILARHEVLLLSFLNVNMIYLSVVRRSDWSSWQYGVSPLIRAILRSSCT